MKKGLPAAGLNSGVALAPLLRQVHPAPPYAVTDVGGDELDEVRGAQMADWNLQHVSLEVEVLTRVGLIDLGGEVCLAGLYVSADLGKGYCRTWLFWLLPAMKVPGCVLSRFQLDGISNLPRVSENEYDDTCQGHTRDQQDLWVPKAQGGVVFKYWSTQKIST